MQIERNILFLSPMNLTKNIVLFLTTGLFLISVSGIMLIYHECDACGKEEVFVNNYTHLLYHESDGCCESTGTCAKDEVHDDCCKDSLSFFKLLDPFLNTYDKVQQVDIQLVYLFLSDTFNSGIKPINLPPENLFYPPDMQDINICVLHCIFRI